MLVRCTIDWIKWKTYDVVVLAANGSGTAGCLTDTNDAERGALGTNESVQRRNSDLKEVEQVSERASCICLSNKISM